MATTELHTDKKLHVLIDCDPGADDVFGVLWLLINHKFAHIPMSVVGITTVGGNVVADKTYANALRLREFLALNDIPVGKDHRQILAQDAAHIHGDDGIGGLASILPEPTFPAEEKDSIDMIIEAIETYGSELAILATGPMTNLALAEERKPGILSQCKKIIAMGGAIKVPGNITPVAEFNIYYDAESAAKVFKATNNIMLAPLDITTSLVFTEEDMNNCFTEIKEDSYKQNFLRGLTKFTIGTNMAFRETAYEKGFFVHDAHTVGLLLYPHLYKGTFYQVVVEDTGEHTKGQTLVDGRNNARIETNTFVATDFDKDMFLEALTEDFKKAGF